jgi:hypothetical protein
MRHLSGKKRFWLAPVFIAGLAALIFITMYLWNTLMPGIFHLPVISYWEAAGLLVLSRILFGFGGHMGGRHDNRRNHLREKWGNMTPEEREVFKSHLKEHRHIWAGSRNFRPSQENSEKKNS